MQTTLYILGALLIGVISAIYLPMNSTVSKHIGSPLTANITFYTVALLTSFVLFAIWGKLDTVGNIKNVPPHLFLTGFISAFIVLAITFLIPKLGAMSLFILSIAGQIIMAMVISHFGFLESPKDPVTVKKIIGAGLLFLGVLVSVI